MIYRVNFANLEPTPAIQEHIHARLGAALRRFKGRVTRVEVHVADLNADRHGPDDKRVMMEARPAGLDPITVESRGSDLYLTVRSAATKLRDALARRTERERDRRR